VPIDAKELAMESRRSFVQSATWVGSAALLAASTAYAQPGSKSRYVDKLTDDTGKYVAGPLPFALDALEPVIDSKTVELHYNFHHKPAVGVANAAEAALGRARDSGDFSQVKSLEKELAFQLSSHLVHTIYWTNLGGKGGAPTGDLARAISAQFGSHEKFESHLASATQTVEASGWGILAYHPMTRKLMLPQCENHQKLTAGGVAPLLVLDVFEPAYYLKYQNRRGEYVGNLFSIINWDNVSERFDAARA
jgi:superoxide dismutase, Fe-Mn family